MKYAIFFLIFLVLAPVFLHAQQGNDLLVPRRLEEKNLNRKSGQKLDGTWLFQAGDTATWLLDSMPRTTPWVPVKTEDSLAALVSCRNCSGRGWLKYRIRLDDSAQRSTPLVIEPRVRGAVEIYLDGKLIMKGGKFSRGPVKGTYMSRQKKVALVIPDTAVHELLVKYEDESLLSKNISEEESETKFSIVVYSANYALERVSRDQGFAMVFTIAAVFLTFFFFHFILFIFYRKDLSNLFFSLFNLGMGIIFLVVYHLLVQRVENNNREGFYMRIFVASIALTGLAFSGLVNNLFGRFGIRFKIILILSLTAMVLMWVVEDVAGIIIVFTQLFIFAEVVFLLLRAYLRKVPGAQILALGILLNIFFVVALAFVFLSYRSLSMGDTQGMLLRYAMLVLSTLSIFSIPMSMSIYLARNVARTNLQLNLRLRQIESLSREKENILEHQKEKLEIEVAERTAELSLQKKKSDDLLLNILPEEVAEELKDKGNAVARHFKNVTVLFTDFVNFTAIAEKAGPEFLVNELHTYFKAFDEIMGRYGLEKIKTIGDAYLAVSGLPVENERHAENAVLAALEMLAYVKAMHGDGHAFKVRIGINSGPLVAGIVGVKKFAYDIWGDTVNMASRMESNSEAGKVNISHNTFELVKDQFVCTYRGKINAKNKGAVDMYFVEAKMENI